MEQVTVTPFNVIETDGKYIYKTAINRDENSRLIKEAACLSHMISIYPGRLIKLDKDSSGRTRLMLKRVPGQSAEKIAPLTEEEVFLIAFDIADQLGDMHELGYVHRDVKPSNIIVSKDSPASMIDFGAAERIEDTDESQSLFRFSTASYTPPEIHLGAENWTPRSDVFSFGVTIYQLLTGNNPFKGPTSDKSADLVCTVEPNRIESVLWPVIKNCTLKHPDDRYDNMRDVFADILRIQDGKKVVDRSPSPEVQKLRMSMANTGAQVKYFYLALACFALICISVPVSYYFGKSKPENQLRIERFAYHNVIPVTFGSHDDSYTIRMRSHNQDYLFSAGEVVEVKPGLYWITIKDTESGRELNSVRRVFGIGKIEPIAEPQAKRRSLIYDRHLHEFRDDEGYLIKLEFKGLVDATKKYRPFQESQEVSYSTALNRLEFSTHRLPTRKELVELGKNPSRYHWFEYATPGRMAKVLAVPRLEPISKTINKKMLK